ncbi:MAG TPA: hypothetical protein VF173_09165 [Thermoanaerobaculia bacterium]|nr:hypothetical protein [Thermoanaerobaculia bacterium]
MGGPEDFVKSLEAIMAAERNELGEPPSPEELLAYRDGRLDPAERRRIEDKIAVYPEAARVLADLAAFPDVEAAPGTPELSDEEIGARWQAFRERLPERPAPRPEVEVGIRRGSRRSPLALPLAAAVLMGLALGGIGGFLGGRASREPLKSAINVKISGELAPVGEGESRSAPSPLEMPAGSEELVLKLGVPVQRDYPDYEAEILNSRGARIWARAGLRPTPEGTIQVSFRQGALEPGLLRLFLYGHEGKGRTLIATYELHLTPGAGPR